MIEISVNGLGKFYGADKIFEGINFDVKTGERVGLIGSNGCGKTTIFKILMDKEDYQEGEVAFRKGISVGYLDQMPNYGDDTTTMDVLRMAFDRLHEIKLKLKELEASFANLEGSALDKQLDSYGKLSEKYEQAGGYDMETNINKMTEGLKISESMQEMAFNQLSGGEKTRVILAKILLESPDMLLLDEPSNHLDMESIEWLEEYLKLYQGTVLIVSHDRYFLDRVVTRIVELEFSKASIYHGNYSYYLIEKERRFLIEMKFYMSQQRKVKQMERQIERYRIWGTMRDSEKMFKKAKELEKRLEKMDKVDRPVIEKKKISMVQGDLKRSGKRVLEIEGLKKAFDNKLLFDDLELNVMYGDSTCMIGPNGAGKTTLLRIILEHIEADEGSVKWGSNLEIGYLPQNVTFEDESLSLVDYISYRYTMPIGEARNLLAKVLFVGDDVFKRIETLSGGEKSRLKLCSLLYEDVNCMVLDEPTNHLDIESREVLENLLLDYDGTILFVSHDRYFITKIATKVCEIDEKVLVNYNGTYDYYREEKLKKKVEKEALVKDKKPKVKKATNPSKETEKAIKKHEREIEEAENQIESYESRIEVINSEMSQEGIGYEELGKLHEDKLALETSVSEAFESLESLEITLEELKGAL